MRGIAENGIAMASCLSVRRSVRLRYRGHILVGCNSWKIILRLFSLTFPLSADPNVTDPLQREHPKMLAAIGVHRENCWFSTFKPLYLGNGTRSGPSCYWPLTVLVDCAHPDCHKPVPQAETQWINDHQPHKKLGSLRYWNILYLLDLQVLHVEN